MNDEIIFSIDELIALGWLVIPSDKAKWQVDLNGITIAWADDENSLWEQARLIEKAKRTPYWILDWRGNFDKRQLREMEFARVYAMEYAHGTDGHHRLMLIHELVAMISAFEPKKG